MNNDILNGFFDADTFVQTNSYILSPSADPGSPAGDGVTTGYGSVGGRAVFAAFQDESVLKGSVGTAHAHKIAACIDMAVKAGVPFVFLIDSAGARIGEGLDVLDGYGRIIKALSNALGIIPVFALVAGKCTGAAALIASMADFVIMPRDGAYFSFSGQDALQAASRADCKKIGSASCAAQAGMLSMVGTDLNDCFQKLRALIGYLPDNSDCEAPAAEAGDDYARQISAGGLRYVRAVRREAADRADRRRRDLDGAFCGICAECRHGICKNRRLLRMYRRKSAFRKRRRTGSGGLPEDLRSSCILR